MARTSHFDTTGSEEYKDVLEKTDQRLHRKRSDVSEIEQFEVRVLAKEDNSSSTFVSSEPGTKRKYFVVDNYEAELVYESEWDYPDSSHGGDIEHATGIAYGLRIASDNE